MAEKQMSDPQVRSLSSPPHLDHEALARAQRETLNTPRRPYGLAARVLFRLLDILYGRKRTLSKFKVLELVARVPYQSWEQVAYIAITHIAQRTGLARRIHDQVAEAGKPGALRYMRSEEHTSELQSRQYLV